MAGKWVANEEQKDMYVSKLGMDKNKINSTNLGMAAGFFYNFDKLGIRLGNVVGDNEAVCRNIEEETTDNVNIMIISGGTIENLTYLWQKTPGIRPVVTLIKDVYKDGSEWKIEQ